MKRVLLDNSNLTTLADARTNEPARFDRFMATWRKRECELVFTRSQLIETRQNSVAATRERRYALLADLLPIHSDIVTREPVPEATLTLGDKEIVRAAIGLGVVRVSGGRAAEWLRDHTEILPSRWDSVVDVVMARSVIEDEMFGKVAAMMKSAAETQAEAQRRQEGEEYRRARLEEVPEQPLSEAQLVEARTAFRQGMQLSDEEIARLFPFNTPEEARAMLEQGTALFERMFERSAIVGARAAHAELLGEIAGVVGQVERRRPYLDELTAQTLFESDVRRVTRERLRVGEDQAHVLSRTLRITDCPARWLVLEVEREIERNEPRPEASNIYDLEHLKFLPYVDALFTDRRMGHYVTSVLRRDGSPDSVRGLAPARWVERSIDALEAAIPN